MGISTYREGRFHPKAGYATALSSMENDASPGWCQLLASSYREGRDDHVTMRVNMKNETDDELQ